MRFLTSLLFAFALPAALGFFGAFLVPANELRQAHAALASDRGLAPAGSGFAAKELFAYALVNVPRIQRLAHEWTTPEAALLREREETLVSLEGFHDTFEYAASSNEMRDSDDFAENFYFWLSQRESKMDFLATLRLSFYGKHGSHVVPWFTIMLNGKTYHLPNDFEEHGASHQAGDSRKFVECERYGVVNFDTVIPMKLWVLNYHGELHENGNPSKPVSVNATFELEFDSNSVFYYQKDWNEMTAARSMSMMAWDKSFWENLTKQNQERYASASKNARGWVEFYREENSVDADSGVETVEKKIDTFSLPELDGSRDHNFGIRRWTFITRYVWWPPLTFDSPLSVDGHDFESLIGSLVDYGNTFKDFAVGGLMASDGAKLSFSHATSMSVFAKKWVDAGYPGKFKGVGEEFVPSHLEFDIALDDGRYLLKIVCPNRGSKSTPELWEHSFYMNGGVFEINEAMTVWHLTLVNVADGDILAQTTATGLLEFGANLVGFS